MGSFPKPRRLLSQCKRGQPPRLHHSKFHGSLQLAAGGVDVAPPWTTDKRGYARSEQYLPKLGYLVLRRSLKCNHRAGVQRDQIYFGAHATDQLPEFASALRGIVHSLHENVFESQVLPVPERKITGSGQQFLQIPFPVDRHQPAAQFVVGCIQRYGQLRSHRLGAKIIDTWHDPCSGDGHARRRDANTLHQEADRSHEILIIQEGLAHAHEDDVHAVLWWRDTLVVEHRAELPHDLAGGQIALYSKQRRQTKLA